MPKSIKDIGHNFASKVNTIKKVNDKNIKNKPDMANHLLFSAKYDTTKREMPKIPIKVGHHFDIALHDVKFKMKKKMLMPIR